MRCLCERCGARCAMIYREELQPKAGQYSRWYFWQCMFCDTVGARALEDVPVDEALFGPAASRFDW